MSIEYMSHLHPGIGEQQVRSLVAQLAADSRWHAHRIADREVGISFIGVGSLSDEMATITIETTEVYVAFHIATRDQRRAVLGFIQEHLAANGTVCELEEL